MIQKLKGNDRPNTKIIAQIGVVTNDIMYYISSEKRNIYIVSSTDYYL